MELGGVVTPLGRAGAGKSTTIALANRLLGADVPAARSLCGDGELRISAVRDAAGPDDPSARVTLLSASPAEGLEYDHVVAVEPAAVAEAEARGLERLYVVLTRAVSRLDVVHGRPLPF